MKKKNKLSLWTFACRKKYYLTHPHRFIKAVYWNIRNFWHRGRYGYAYSDVWEWYTWWTTVGAEALRYMAEHGSGYPGTGEWDTPEKWHDYLNSMADKLEWSAQSCECGNHEEENEYHKMHDEILERKMECGMGKNGIGFSRVNSTPEEEDIIKRYWAREEELMKQDDVTREQIFTEIGRNLGRFWD